MLLEFISNNPKEDKAIAYYLECLIGLNKYELRFIINNKLIKIQVICNNDNPILQIIDIWSYRIIGLGFPFLTIGIISGAVWANEAWGSYWSWDPKETWALISWLFNAAYLHMRISKGWQGRKPALLASTGFLVVLVCYLGVNFLGIGLHSYGWIFG